MRRCFATIVLRAACHALQGSCGVRHLGTYYATIHFDDIIAVAIGRALIGWFSTTPSNFARPANQRAPDGDTVVEVTLSPKVIAAEYVP